MTKSEWRRISANIIKIRNPKCYDCGKHFKADEKVFHQRARNGRVRYFCTECENDVDNVTVRQLRGFGEDNYKDNSIDKTLLERYEAYLAVKQLEGGEIMGEEEDWEEEEWEEEDE